MTQHPNMLIILTDQWLDVKNKKKKKKKKSPALLNILDLLSWSVRYSKTWYRSDTK